MEISSVALKLEDGQPCDGAHAVSRAFTPTRQSRDIRAGNGSRAADGGKGVASGFIIKLINPVDPEVHPRDV